MVDFVVFDAVGDDVHGFFPAADFVYNSVLVFQRLVNGEEMTHFFENMGLQVVDGLDGIVIRIGVGDGNDLFVQSAAVSHFDNADGIALHQCQRNQRFGADQQYIQRVIVVCIGQGNKAVVGRVVGGGRLLLLCLL